MTSLGVWSCQWRELRPINFGSGGGANAAAAAEGGSTGEAESVGGSNRGGGRDGAGEYELVAMKESVDENV
jgi:protein SYS1